MRKGLTLEKAEEQLDDKWGELTAELLRGTNQTMIIHLERDVAYWERRDEIGDMRVMLNIIYERLG